MLVSRLPACKDKIHKLGKTNIICHTHLAAKSRLLTETLLSLLTPFRRATPSKLFHTSKTEKRALSQHLTGFCILHFLHRFVCLYCFQINCFPLSTSRFSPSDSTRFISQFPRGDSAADRRLAPRLKRSPTNTGESRAHTCTWPPLPLAYLFVMRCQQIS